MAAVKRFALAAIVAAWPTGVWSQQPSSSADPVLANFRDYRAALERNDLAAAEAAATAALAASEATSGRRTAVLALNLANVRLELGGNYDALTPALKAHSVASASADAGVDRVGAALTLGRAELAAGNAAGGPRLREAIRAGAGNEALQVDVYNAAVALGDWSIDAKDYPTAREAWATAARLAVTTDESALSRARALTGEGAAIFLASHDRSLEDAVELSAADVKTASDAFALAQRLLLPTALTDRGASGELTASQLGYAEAMAWQSALFATLQMNGAPLPQPPAFGSDVPPFDPNAYCRMRSIRDREIDYPPEALYRYGVAAVVAHFGLDAEGAITSRTVAAAVPGGALAKAVDDADDRWRIEKDPASAPGCRVPASAFVDVRFVVDD